MDAKSITLNERIQHYLLKIVESSRTGEQLPSVRQLHSIFHCSHSTVDKALGELERRGFVERQPGKGTFVAAHEKRILAEQHRHTFLGNILMAYPDHVSFEYSMLVRHAETLATRRGYNLINLKMKRDTCYTYLFDTASDTGDLAGIIILPTSELSSGVLETLEKQDVPVAVLACQAPDDRQHQLHFVCPDYVRSGYLLMAYLLDLGHRRVAYVRNEPAVENSRLRYSGIKKGLYKYGLRLRDLKRSPRLTELWEDAALHARESTFELMASDKPPTAFLYDSFLGALAGVRALGELGKSVPADVSVVGEGTVDHADHLHPRITATHYDMESMIAGAFTVLLDNPDTPAETIVPFHLDRAESTAEPCEGGVAFSIGQSYNKAAD